jgi:predicted AlkP superfamily phosphohydrolase/phosphomutase
MGGGRTVIIGLDGVPFEMITSLAEAGVMPNTQRIIKSGCIRRIASTIPDISSIAWSSIISGRNAGEHGIFGFTDLVKGTYQMRFPSFSDMRASAFWETCEGKSVIINVPSTYPVKPMNGVHISGFVSIDIARAVYPGTLVSRLQEMDYRLDVDSEKAHSDMGLFLDDVDTTLISNVAAYRWLWESQDWRNFMLVFTTTDRLLHFLWSAWEDKEHQHHRRFVAHFAELDGVIGEIADRMTDDDSLLMMSDHGFERLDHDIYVNRVLIEAGLLRFEPGAQPMPGNIAAGARVFAMDPGRIYINLKGRYPNGSVLPQDKQKIVDEVTELFSKMTVGGRRVVRTICRGEEVYSGPYAADGPDLVLMAQPGFNLKGAMGAPQVAGRGIFTGMHRYDNAFLLSAASGGLAGIGEGASVIDAGRLIMTLSGGGQP